VFAEILGVVYVWVSTLAPEVANGEPPLAAAYQLNVPAVSADALNATVPVPHRLPSVILTSLMVARTTVRG
jgi:hypothetical protein